MIPHDAIDAVVETFGGGDAARELLLYTGAAESGYRTKRQHGGGPALGYFQCEPATHDDIWRNYLDYRPALGGKVLSFLNDGETKDAETLVSNDRYAAAICRVHYLRQRDPLPMAGDRAAQAEYWLRLYNAGGKGSIKHFLDAAEALDG